MTRDSDQFKTDDWLLKLFEDWYDPCPLNKHPEINGLEVDWQEKTFVNPPYSNIKAWVIKALREWQKGCCVVLLLRMDTSTEWFKMLQEAGARFLWINGRLRHGGEYPAPHASMLAVLS